MREFCSRRLIDDDGEHHREQQVVVLDRAVEAEAAESERVDAGDALRAVGDVHRARQVVEEDADDLAEAERDDGEVVAAQLERRRAEQHAEQRGDRRADRQDHPERQVQAELRAGEQRVDVGADGVERDVAEVEQAGEADDDVQAQREHDVEDREVRDAHPGGADLRQCERQQRRARGRSARLRPRSARAGRACRSTAASGPVSDALAEQPGGRNTSTRISTMNANTSW